MQNVSKLSQCWQIKSGISFRDVYNQNRVCFKRKLPFFNRENEFKKKPNEIIFFLNESFRGNIFSFSEIK